VIKINKLFMKKDAIRGEEEPMNLGKMKCNFWDQPGREQPVLGRR